METVSANGPIVGRALRTVSFDLGRSGAYRNETWVAVSDAEVASGFAILTDGSWVTVEGIETEAEPSPFWARVTGHWTEDKADPPVPVMPLNAGRSDSVQCRMSKSDHLPGRIVGDVRRLTPTENNRYIEMTGGHTHACQETSCGWEPVDGNDLGDVEYQCMCSGSMSFPGES